MPQNENKWACLCSLSFPLPFLSVWADEKAKKEGGKGKMDVSEFCNKFTGGI